jgi:O-antigen/teichoic acid export membrane protein
MTDITPNDGYPLEEDEQPLGGLVRRSLHWSFASSTAARLGSIVSGIVLARILTPHDFGVYTVGAIALAVSAAINDIGIEPTIVRWPGDLDAIAPTATSVVMIASLALFVAFWFAATPFAKLMNAPESGVGIVRLMSAGLIISGAGTVSAGVITREFRQRARAIAETSGLVLSIVLTIVLAKAGLGAFSLAWGHIAGNLITALLLIGLAPRRWRPGFKWTTSKALLRAGFPIAGAGLLMVAIQNVDYMVVGSILGTAALGLYLLAWNVSSFPVGVLTGTIGHVSVAGFAKLQHSKEDLHRAFQHSLQGLVAITVPIGAALVGLSLPLIRLVYGAKWSGSANPLRFLAIVGVIRVAALLFSDLLIAEGRGRMVFGLQAVWLALLTPSLVLGAEASSIGGVGLAHLSVVVIVVIPLNLLVMNRRGIPVWTTLAMLRRPVVGGFVMAAVCAGATQMPAPDLARLGLGGLSGMLVYLGITRPIWREPLASWRDRRSQPQTTIRAEAR